MIKLAVTGGIACGKSTVGHFLKNDHTWPVLDTDNVAHEVLLRPDIKADIRDRFGAEVVNEGRIDRSVLGQYVFSDTGAREWLNSLMHPEIRKACASWVETQGSDGHVGCAVLIPLLFETGQESIWDQICCVGASRSVQVERLRNRGLTDRECEQRLSAQMSVEEKMNLADFGIMNDMSREVLQEQLRRVVLSIGGK